MEIGPYYSKYPIKQRLTWDHQGTAPIHCQQMSRGEARFWACQKVDSLGDLFRGTHTAHCVNLLTSLQKGCVVLILANHFFYLIEFKI
jgi:hypothetical protein